MPTRKTNVLKASDVQKALADIDRIVSNLHGAFHDLPGARVLAKAPKGRRARQAGADKRVQAGVWIGPWPLFIGQCEKQVVSPLDPVAASHVPAGMRGKLTPRGRK